MYDKIIADRDIPTAEPEGKRLSPYVKLRLILAGAAALLFAAGLLCGFFIGRASLPNVSEGSAAEKAQPTSVVYEDNVPDSIVLPSYIEEALLPVNPYSRCGDKLRRVNNIVIHYVGNPNTTAEQNRKYFENLAETHETSASSNLIVGMEGEVLLCVPLDEVAYCSNYRNYDTISIEFCHPARDGMPTQATYDSLIRLTAWLCDLYGLDAETAVIRHYDVSGKDCPLFFVNNEAAWQHFKDEVSAAQSR